MGKMSELLEKRLDENKYEMLVMLERWNNLITSKGVLSKRDIFCLYRDNEILLSKIKEIK